MTDPWLALEKELQRAAEPLPRVPRRLRRKVLKQAGQAHRKSWRIERAQITAMAVLLLLMICSIAGYYGGMLQTAFRTHIDENSSETTAYRRQVLDSAEASSDSGVIEASEKLKSRSRRVITGAFWQ